LLAITKPWPSMLRTIWGDDARYVQTYFTKWPGRPDVYFPGDGAKRDEDQYFWILGRVDDVLKISGHRIARWSREPRWWNTGGREAAVVGKAHAIKGEAIAAFVTLRDGRKPSPALADEFEGVRVEEDRRAGAARRHSFLSGSSKTRSGRSCDDC